MNRKWIRPIMRAFVAMLALWAMPLGAAAQTTGDVRVDIEVNGQRLVEGGLIYEDRTYVKLEDVAGLLGGRYLHDPELNLAFVLTGNYLDLVADTLAARNPELESYHQISHFVQGRGVHFGMPSPHLTVAFIQAGLATAFVQIHAEGLEEHRPWFDQQPNAHERFLAGDGYSQHLFVIDPALITRNEATRIVFNGEGLNIGPEGLLWHRGALYVGLRVLAEASGGGVDWNGEERLVTAKVVPGSELTWNVLATLNEQAVGHYQRDETFSDGNGHRYVTSGPGLLIEVDELGRVTAVGSAFPSESTMWFPWYDQSLSAPIDVPGIGKAYSQHIYIGGGK